MACRAGRCSRPATGDRAAARRAGRGLPVIIGVGGVLSGADALAAARRRRPGAGLPASSTAAPRWGECPPSDAQPLNTREPRARNRSNPTTNTPSEALGRLFRLLSCDWPVAAGACSSSACCWRGDRRARLHALEPAARAPAAGGRHLAGRSARCANAPRLAASPAAGRHAPSGPAATAPGHRRGPGAGSRSWWGRIGSRS